MEQNNTSIATAFLLFLLIGLQSISHAQETIFNHLYELEEVPTIKIETDLKHLVRHKIKEEYQPATVTILSLKGDLREWTTKVRARGNIRKKVCHFPPIKINFKEKELASAGFDSLDILKLVLQCRSSKRTVSYVVKERLAYDLYAMIDTNSMRAKMVNVEFWNEGEMKESLSAFLVETEDHYSQRLNSRIAESGKLNSSILKRDHYLKMTFFQYMIGNVDWAIQNKHNVEIIQTADKKYIAVPYDFDYSGLVNTDYATPHKSLPIDEVTERFFMSKGVKIGEAIATAAYFISMKDGLYKCVTAASYLDDDDKEEVIHYLDGFYQTMESERSLKRAMVK